MHDMGYLSQVAASPIGGHKKPVTIRDFDGIALPKYKNYVQKIRTPALKNLGLNRFVTDSYRNTKSYINEDSYMLDAACDFLLHDGRACDAVEAASCTMGRRSEARGDPQVEWVESRRGSSIARVPVFAMRSRPWRRMPPRRVNLALNDDCRSAQAGSRCGGAHAVASPFVSTPSIRRDLIRAVVTYTSSPQIKRK